VNDPRTSLGAIVSRPSQTTSVCTGAPNHILIETGHQNTSSARLPTTAQYSQAFVRIGTAVPALEIDLGRPVYERVQAAGASTSGSPYSGAGLKHVFGCTPRFNYGASVFFTAPTGTNRFCAGLIHKHTMLNYGCTLNTVWLRRAR
jgi:hypothetical protein